jgi:predicted dienelactone hydrolase
MATAETVQLDFFVRGPLPVGVRTIQAHDAARNRLFPCEIWYPATSQFAGGDVASETMDIFTIASKETRRQNAVRDAAAQPDGHPLIIYSHPSVQHRRAATFLCTHLASHGYVVAALDHSEVIAPELARRDGETEAERAARWEALIGSRVPDARFLIDFLVAAAEFPIDTERIGIVGHSFGGWTALETAGADARIRAVVALAPGGASNPKPGILPLQLNFQWNIPTLFLVAENDVSLPLAGMYEIFERTVAAKLMVILRRADHLHFMDDVAQLHEAFRTMPAPEPLASMQKEMRPMAELCSAEQSHLFTRGLTLAHLDAILRDNQDARRLLAGDIAAELAAKGVEAMVRRA